MLPTGADRSSSMENDQESGRTPTPALLTLDGYAADHDGEEEEEDSDDEVWESVNVSSSTSVPQSELEISIPLLAGKRPFPSQETDNEEGSAKKIKGKTKKEKLERQEIHKTHLLTLMACGMTRNRLANNMLLQAVGLSLIPLSIQSKLSTQKNSRIFFSYVKELVLHWQSLVPLSKLEIMTLDEVELPRSVEERSALLFIAALRAFKIKTRLVCSLHPIPLSLAKNTEYLPSLKPLQLWSEMYSEFSQEWISCHTLKNLVNSQLHKFVQPQSSHPQSEVSYVLAYDDVFGIRDVTKKYTTQWGARTSALRLRGKGESWWYETLLNHSRSWRDKTEELEDQNLKASEVNEQMPANIQGFKNHPLYALERHLKKNQAIYPLGIDHSVGRFKNELVYPRSLVHDLLSKENWLRQGRTVDEDQSPLKKVTTNTKTGSEVDLFGLWHTKPTERPHLQNGKLPRNVFGNFEIYHETMIPLETVHLRKRGLPPIAKKLGIDFVPVMTGFEYHGGKRPIPVLDGILVKKSDSDIILSVLFIIIQLLYLICARYSIITQAWMEVMSHQTKEAKLAQSVKAVNNWMRLTVGLLNRQRLRDKYLK